MTKEYRQRVRTRLLCIAGLSMAIAAAKHAAAKGPEAPSSVFGANVTTSEDAFVIGGHRPYFSVGYFAGIGSVPHKQTDQSGAGVGFGGHVGYARRWMNGLEAGIDLMAAASSSGGVSSIFLPALSLRPYVPVGKAELGILALRLGWGILSGPAGYWSAPGAATSIDFRYWYAERAALQLSAEGQISSSTRSGLDRVTWMGVGFCAGVAIGF
jgi:hypothetical protein